jgi:phage tail sheath protein FI
MAFSYKTPGVYPEEITKLPPSVASVETAIPCFFGVTEKALEVKEKDLIGKAQKVRSLAEYEYYFGGPDKAVADVVVNLNTPSEAKLKDGKYMNKMYYAVKHYFDNGGGPCYIHSVGDYDRKDAAAVAVDGNTYKNELLKIDLLDEATLIVFPDLAALGNKDLFYDVYNAALQKASDLKDKFVIVDVYPEPSAQGTSAEKSKSSLRNTISSTPELIKYGAAYFPNLETVYSYDFNSANINMTFAKEITDKNTSANLLNNFNYKDAKGIFAVYNVLSFFNDEYFKNILTASYTGKAGEIIGKANSISSYFIPAEQQTLTDNAKKLSDELKTQGDTAVAASKVKYDFSDTGKQKENLIKQLQDKILAMYAALPDAIKNDLKNNKAVKATSIALLTDTFLTKITPFFNSEFEARLRKAFLEIPLLLPPSPAIAGIYATVDRNRGVWKAPANVSLNAVKKPEVLLSDYDQADFNVDAENGKSINCIRNFIGRGNLVWGARTLAGNNNEWKYVNVRRFFNMAEESCENAARQFVFEPNDANTWVRVKGMIDNYLTNLWREGALQGAKPEHAFYTAVGLNQTMTPDDILNGMLIVEIGLAVVRPAEFIILRFSHKMAQS